MSQVFVAANQTFVVTSAGSRLTGNPAYSGQAISFGASGSGVFITLDFASGGTYGLAQGTIVEFIDNVGGSEFADAITGNARGNILIGGGGNDNLMGLGGDDILLGGTGSNSLDGGSGFDTANYSGASAGITLNLAGGIVLRADGQDAVTSIERIIGTDFTDFLNGSAAADQLEGGNGNDALYGFGGNDTLLGGAGDDNVVTGTGNNVVDGGIGYDTIYYNANTTAIVANLTAGIVSHDGEIDSISNVEVIFATAFDDVLISGISTSVLYGADGNDLLVALGTNATLFGGAGDDELRSGANADWLDGGAGVDTVVYSAATAGVEVDLNGGAASTNGVVDYLFGIENVTGSDFDDILFGNGSANLLKGGLGADALVGGQGNDTLLGGAGDDQLVGGQGSNVIDGGTGYNQLYFND